MKRKNLFALLLALAMLFALSACKPAASEESGQPDPTQTQTAEPSEELPDESAEPSAPAEPDQPLRLAVLSGPTGVGAAKLLSDIDSDPDSLSTEYGEYIIGADNSELVAGLTNGTIDIATMASNAAVNLYNRTEGGVKIIALGTQGVLHILESGGGTAIQSVEDLVGKTVYATGQGANPEYILRYLLEESGVDPDEDVEIVFAEPGEITQRLLTGEAEVAMLPVPAATAAILQSKGSVRAALDVTQEWDALQTGSQLIMTAVVARTEFLEAYPGKVDAFLQDYAASIGYVNENVAEAAELVAGLGITPSAAIAREAIPQCHLIYIDGADMAPAISDYFMMLYSVSPSSVGGSLPDDGIYYVP